MIRIAAPRPATAIHRFMAPPPPSGEEITLASFGLVTGDWLHWGRGDQLRHYRVTAIQPTVLERDHRTRAQRRAGAPS